MSPTNRHRQLRGAALPSVSDLNRSAKDFPMSTNAPSEKKPDILDPKANLKALSRIVVLIVVLGGGIWLFVRFTAGEKAANRVASVVLRQPIEVKDSIEDLPASSFKALALTLPYTGTISVEVTVRKGNDIDVYVVSPDQIEKIKKKERFTYFEGLQAQKTQNYRRSGRLEAGSYYLVLLDRSLGILSQSSTDVHVHVRLEP
jgi:hypothetical protein